MSTIQDNASAETNAAYHADTSHVSSSMLKALAKSPRVYESRYILGEQPDETASQRLGSAGHCLGFEPDEFDERYVVSPYPDRRTKLYKEWAEKQRGRSILRRCEYDSAERAVESLRRVPIIKAILDAPGLVEQSIRVTDRETGIPCKIRLDKILPDARTPIIFDIKTISECTKRKFAYACQDFGYAIQDAHYRTVARQHFDRDGWLMVFGVVETKAPFRARAFQLDPESQQHGLDERYRLLCEWQDRTASGDWSEPGEHEITKVTLPNLNRRREAF